MANHSAVPIPINAKVFDENDEEIGSINVLANRKLDLQIFGYLQTHSRLGEIELADGSTKKVRYIPKQGNSQESLFKNFKKYVEENNEEPVVVCCFSTFKTKLRELKVRQMVVDKSIQLMGDDKPIKVYVIETQFNIFQYVPYATMEQLVYGTNSATIKVYGYLLNKYKMAQGKDVVFYSKELLAVLGMSDTHMDNYRCIGAILYTLEAYGLLKYTIKTDSKNDGVIEKKIITYLGVDLKKVERRNEGKKN